MNGLPALSILGGLLALDGTSVAQTMVSRPLVAGVVTGWAVGRPVEGGLVGLVLEIYLLVSFPVGGARFPEGATATVVAVAVAAASPHPGALALGVATGLVWGQLGGVSATALRRLNERIVPHPEEGTVTRRSVEAAHWGAVGLDFLRGAAVAGSGIAVGRTLVPWSTAWPLGRGDTVGMLLVGAAVSLGVLYRSFGGLSRTWLCLLGLLVGVVAGVALGVPPGQGGGAP